MVRSRMRWMALGALLLLLVPALAACGGSSSGGGGTAVKKKIGLVTDIGGLNDQGFNHLAYLGLQQAITDFGVQGDVLQSKSGDDYVPNLTHFASLHYDLVIGVGFLMQVAIAQVSQSYPTVKFAIVDGDPTDTNSNVLTRANVEGIHFKEQEAGALVGVIAGMLEKENLSPKKSGIISAVGGISIPPVNHYIAGYAWAAMMEDPAIAANPAKDILVDYSNDFTNANLCRSKALGQIAKGSDIVFQVAGGCGLGALQAAGTAGVYSIGVDTDQKGSSPSVIASAVKRVDTATYLAIKSIVQGNFQSGMVFFTLANGGVDFATGNTTLPADITAEVTKVEGEIKAGTLTPPDTIPTGVGS
jgi:basic membrane protein A and related proteins